MSRAVIWALVVGALLLPGRPIYAVLYLIGGVWLLAHWSTRSALGRLHLRRTLGDTRIFFGEQVAVTLHLTNRSPFPIPWLRIHESRPQALAVGGHEAVLSLAPGAEATLTYRLEGLRRGRYEIGPLAFVGGDPFGLIRLDGRFPETDSLTVYPPISALPALGLPARLPMGDLAARQRLFEDPSWLAGTRPYEQGDSMRRIHWPATARTGEMISRQYRYAMLLPAAVCLNLNRADYPGGAIWQSELAVTAAASLARHLIEQKQQVALVAAAEEPEHGGGGRVTLPLRQGHAGLISLLEQLARVEVTAVGAPFAEVLAEEARRLPPGTLLAVITPSETEAVAASCGRLVRAGYGVLLFVLDGESGQRAGGYQVWRLHQPGFGKVEVG